MKGHVHVGREVAALGTKTIHGSKVSRKISTAIFGGRGTSIYFNWKERPKKLRKEALGRNQQYMLSNHFGLYPALGLN